MAPNFNIIPALDVTQDNRAQNFNAGVGDRNTSRLGSALEGFLSTDRSMVQTNAMRAETARLNDPRKLAAEQLDRDLKNMKLQEDIEIARIQKEYLPDEKDAAIDSVRTTTRSNRITADLNEKYGDADRRLAQTIQGLTIRSKELDLSPSAIEYKRRLQEADLDRKILDSESLRSKRDEDVILARERLHQNKFMKQLEYVAREREKSYSILNPIDGIETRLGLDKKEERIRELMEESSPQLLHDRIRASQSLRTGDDVEDYLRSNETEIEDPLIRDREIAMKEVEALEKTSQLVEANQVAVQASDQKEQASKQLSELKRRKTVKDAIRSVSSDALLTLSPAADSDSTTGEPNKGILTRQLLKLNEAAKHATDPADQQSASGVYKMIFDKTSPDDLLAAAEGIKDETRKENTKKGIMEALVRSGDRTRLTPSQSYIQDLELDTESIADPKRVYDDLTSLLKGPKGVKDAKLRGMAGEPIILAARKASKRGEQSFSIDIEPVATSVEGDVASQGSAAVPQIVFRGADGTVEQTGFPSGDSPSYKKDFALYQLMEDLSAEMAPGMEDNQRAQGVVNANRQSRDAMLSSQGGAQQGQASGGVTQQPQATKPPPPTFENVSKLSPSQLKSEIDKTISKAERREARRLGRELDGEEAKIVREGMRRKIFKNLTESQKQALSTTSSSGDAKKKSSEVAKGSKDFAARATVATAAMLLGPEGLKKLGKGLDDGR